MVNIWGKRYTTVLAMGVVLLFLGGCGFKNQPVPPQTVVPEPISDFRYTIDSKGVVFDWSYPVSTVKGTPIEDIESFELYRAEVALEDVCSNCPIPFAGIAELEGGAVHDGVLRRTGTYANSFLQSGYKYFYKIRSRVSWWASSDDSNIISFVWFTPAVSPEGLKAQVGDGNVQISWEPVRELVNGGALTLPVRYQLQRSVAGKPFQNMGSPSVLTSYTDDRVKLGQKYFYRVQSMLAYEGEYAAGGVSDSIAAVSVDLSPPPPPSGVTVVRVGTGIKVFWEQVTAPDLGGYRIYRRLAGDTEFTMIADLDTSFVTYVDAEARDGVRYYYVVTARDTSTPTNESPRSREATPRYQ